MSDVVKITSIDPNFALPDGEIVLNCECFDASLRSNGGCYIAGQKCRIVAASSQRVMATVPNNAADGKVPVHLESDGVSSNPHELTVGRKIAGNMHIVANPAVDPYDDAIILTRSGGRGQQLPETLFRLDTDGHLDVIPETILNPTGVAFDRDGVMYVTNRAEGEVYAIKRNGAATVYATCLGIATGLAFDQENRLYVGDRSGTIYRVQNETAPEVFALIEPSVAAYHMAFGPDGRLYVTAPGLASHDTVYAVDKKGDVTIYFRGFGRPQGLAFDKAGNLYVAACYKGRHGIVRISNDGKSCEHFVAGNNIVGLCFTRNGAMIVATGDSVYSIQCEIEGTLL